MSSNHPCWVDYELRFARQMLQFEISTMSCLSAEILLGFKLPVTRNFGRQQGKFPLSGIWRCWSCSMSRTSKQWLLHRTTVLDICGIIQCTVSSNKTNNGIVNVSNDKIAVPRLSLVLGKMSGPRQLRVSNDGSYCERKQLIVTQIVYNK